VKCGKSQIEYLRLSLIEVNFSVVNLKFDEVKAKEGLATCFLIIMITGRSIFENIYDVYQLDLHAGNRHVVSPKNLVFAINF